MARLAINGGTPVRKEKLKEEWPIWDHRDEEALLKVLHSGDWGGVPGTAVREFEPQLAAYCGARRAVCLSSGTAALEAAYQAVGAEPGDEIIVPAYTFIATASAACIIGAVPVFVDIEPQTLNMDPARAEAAITERTRAIVPVHIGGRPANMDAIMAIARRHGLAVVEDAAQAIGAVYKGKKAGSIGDAGTLSFQSSKNLTAGEGGAVLTNSDDIYLRCYSLINVGRIPKGDWYQHDQIGTNLRMTGLQAALLQSQMTRLEEQNRRRRENAAHLISLLKDIEGVTPPPPDDPAGPEGSTGPEGSAASVSAWHLFAFRYHKEHFGGAPKSAFLKAMNAEGIPLGGGYNPLNRSGMIRLYFERLAKMGLVKGRHSDPTRAEIPAIERACNEEVVWFSQRCLLGTKSDMEAVAAAVRKIKENAGELLAAS